MVRKNITWGGSTSPRSTGKFTTNAQWRSQGGTAWNVRIEYEDKNGRRFPVGVQIGAGGKTTEELTSRALREIPFATIFEEWLKATSNSRATPTVDPKVAGPLKGGPLPVEVLEKVAELYRSALDRGAPPNKFVAQELGISQSTATKRIVRARREGLLGPTTPGKRGESK